MQIKARFYDELCGDAMYIRKAVFMQEQGFYNEFDETDKISTHVVLYNTDGKPVATGRLFPDSDKPNSYIIGRVAVLKEFRRNKCRQHFTFSSVQSAEVLREFRLSRD